MSQAGEKKGKSARRNDMQGGEVQSPDGGGTKQTNVNPTNKPPKHYTHLQHPNPTSCDSSSHPPNSKGPKPNDWYGGNKQSTNPESKRTIINKAGLMAVIMVGILASLPKRPAFNATKRQRTVGQRAEEGNVCVHSKPIICAHCQKICKRGESGVEGVEGQRGLVDSRQ